MQIKTLCLLFLCLVPVSCQKEDREPSELAVPVRAVPLAFSDYRYTIKLTGEIAAHIQSNLSFRVSGKVTEWTADIGSHVAAGQVIARVDPQQQKADVEAAQAALVAAQADVDQATSEFERRKTLLASGSISKESYDQAATALQTSQGSLDNARAQLGTTKDALGYTDLKTDSAGIVTARNVEVGQVMQAAQTAFTVAQDGPRDAVFYIYETLLQSKPGNPRIEVALVSDPTVKAFGKVTEVSPTIDTSTGTVRVKITLEETPPQMTLGAPVTGSAQSAPMQMIVLPWTALFAIDGNPAVWVVDPKDATVNLKPVKVATYETGRVIVSGGLENGETVVIDGGKLLRPGQKVTVEGGQS
jgi:RND family efflux transporter MFP subunit